MTTTHVVFNHSHLLSCSFCRAEFEWVLWVKIKVSSGLRPYLDSPLPSSFRCWLNSIPGGNGTGVLHFWFSAGVGLFQSLPASFSFVPFGSPPAMAAWIPLMLEISLICGSAPLPLHPARESAQLLGLVWLDGAHLDNRCISQDSPGRQNQWETITHKYTCVFIYIKIYRMKMSI